MSNLVFVAQFVASKVGLDGLSPTWDIERITRSDGTRSALVTGGATNIAIGRRGQYGYLLTGADLTLYAYTATAITADASVDQKEMAAMADLVLADTIQVSGDGGAADNLELFFDGTGYASAGSINSVLGTVTLADNGITADKLAASAITEIQSGLATAAALEAVDDYLDTEIAAIKAKTDLISAATLTVSSPVAENGDTELYAGDDYNNSDGRALEWSSSDWPDLTAATITLYLRAPDGSKFSKAGSAPVVGSSSQTARVELTAAETATLIDWPTPSTLRLRATLAVSGRIVTLVTGVLTVAEDIS